MKEKFREIRFKHKNQELLNHCLKIVQEYESKSIKITLRQLYYQLVSRGIIVNSEKEYHRLGKVLTDARYGGYIDWNIIEDNTRIPYIPSVFDNLPDLVQCAIESYSLDRWQNQDCYIELYTEKDALTSLLKPIASKWNIYFNVNRGYSSATAIYFASKRYLDNMDKKQILFYIGDHDPSGLDMLRDIESRFNEFNCGDVLIIPIALTLSQIEQYQLPPNPTKITDTRAKNYISQYGDTSYEADALSPDVLTNLVEKQISDYVDMDKWNNVIASEQIDMKKLEELFNNNHRNQ